MLCITCANLYFYRIYHFHRLCLSNITRIVFYGMTIWDEKMTGNVHYFSLGCMVMLTDDASHITHRNNFSPGTKIDIIPFALNGRCHAISKHYNDVTMNDMASINHRPRDCLLNRLFRRRSKKTSKLRVTGLCGWNSQVTGEFPAQRTSNTENVSFWWRHHDIACLSIHLMGEQAGILYSTRCEMKVTRCR